LFGRRYFVVIFRPVHIREPENMDTVTLISVATREFVAFSFAVTNLPLEPFALSLSVCQVSLPSVRLAKQGAISYRATTIITQSGTLVAQLEFALS
jgi:hypothetical protein